MQTCHTQRNPYRVREKTWLALGPTKGEQSCGYVRMSSEVPDGDPVNESRKLSKEEAIYIAMQQPGGGVIHCYNGDNWNVYSETRAVRYKEILRQLKQRQFNTQRGRTP